MNWCSVIPLHNFAFDRDEPVEFAGGLKLSPIPPWLKDDLLTQRLGARDREVLETATHGFVAEYDAVSLGDPGSTWKRATPKSVKDTKYEMAVLPTSLSAWSDRPPSASLLCSTLPDLGTNGQRSNAKNTHPCSATPATSERCSQRTMCSDHHGFTLRSLAYQGITRYGPQFALIGLPSR